MPYNEDVEELELDDPYRIFENSHNKDDLS